MFFVGFIINGLLAAFGAQMAKSRRRNPVAWGIACFLLWPLFIPLLLILGTDHSVPAPVVEPKVDWTKWKTLVDVDPDVSEAAKRVSAHGRIYEERLATRFLALNEKSYLPAIVDRILREIKTGGGAPIDGAFNGAKYRRKADGNYIVVSGRGIGRIFPSLLEMEQFLSRNRA